MQPPITTRTRLVLLALPLAGLLFIVGILGRGPSLDPAVDPDAFARSSVAAWASGAWFVILIGMVLEVPGLFALYLILANRQRERLAFWGALLSMLGVVLVIPLIGFMALAAPTVGQLYLEGHIDVMAVAVQMASVGPALILAIISGAMYCAGSTCMALVLRGILPRILLVAYALQAPLLTFVAPFSVTAELIGAVLLLICGAWIIWRTQQESAQANELPAAPANI